MLAHVSPLILHFNLSLRNKRGHVASQIRFLVAASAIGAARGGAGSLVEAEGFFFVDVGLADEDGNGEVVDISSL